MSWSEATRPASRMKDCEDERRTVDLGGKTSDGDIKKKASGPAVASPSPGNNRAVVKFPFGNTIMTTVQKIKVFILLSI
jgi:hypothetical protein